MLLLLLMAWSLLGDAVLDVLDAELAPTDARRPSLLVPSAPPTDAWSLLGSATSGLGESDSEESESDSESATEGSKPKRARIRSLAERWALRCSEEVINEELMQGCRCGYVHKSLTVHEIKTTCEGRGAQTSA